MGAETSFIPARIWADLPAPPEQERAAQGIVAAEIDALDGLSEMVPESSGGWPEPVRALYRTEVEARLYREQHFLFMLGLITCLLTVALDALINPDMVREGALLRILIIGPVTILGMIAAQKGWSRMLALCVITAPAAFAGLIVHLTFHLPPDYAASYLTATTLIICAANIVLPLPGRWLLAFNFIFIAIALAVLGLGPEGTLAASADYILLLGIVAAATLYLAARIERLRQRNFLLNLRTRISADELRKANRRLRDLSERDPLTGVLNRRGFTRVFDQRIGAPESGHGEARAVLIMADIDHFKHFNDTHGHQSGDTCLSMVASAMQSIAATSGGVVARYGGEEFVAALREESPGHAEQIAEQIRNAIEGLLVPVGQEHGPAGRSLVTASIGVGVGETIGRELDAESCEAMREELIEMADAALYSAKRNGRNRVEVVRRADPIARSA